MLHTLGDSLVDMRKTNTVTLVYIKEHMTLNIET
jgi:hypothetical protein